MIHFVVTRPHSYTITPLTGSCFGAEIPPCKALPYDELFSSRRLRGGTYIFCDIERLSDPDLLLAAQVYRTLLEASCCRVLNDPARVKIRYALLRSLSDAGLNMFDAYRADGHPRPQRFPVFIRAEAEHGPALTDLLPDQEALDMALQNLRAQGRPLRGLIVIEYRAESIAPGIFRRYGAFRIGNAISLDHVVTEDKWNVKRGKIGLATEDMYREDYRAIRDNRFASELWEAFQVAEIEYGRADFGLVNGHPQIYEINTNPALTSLRLHPSETRMATKAFAHRRFAEFLTAIYVPEQRTRITLDIPALSGVRNSIRLANTVRTILSPLRHVRELMSRVRN